MRIPGPTKPAYLLSIRFILVNKLAIPRARGSGLLVLVTLVADEIDPLGRPVWNTLLMLTCSGDISSKRRPRRGGYKGGKGRGGVRVLSSESPFRVG
jgi:hypothetical protein